MNRLAVSSVFGFLVSLITSALGGWDAGLQTLIVFVCFDYFMGVIVAGLFKTSGKTPSGSLSSQVMLRGIIKKVGEFVLVAMAVRLDNLLQLCYIRDGVIISLIINEGLSILENLGLCGVPIPEVITKALDALRGEKDERE